jgi:hypothetical protein
VTVHIEPTGRHGLPQVVRQPATRKAESPESRASETRASETRAPESRAPESRVPESRAPDTRTPETRTPETRTPETRTSTPETGTRAHETRARETGNRHAGAVPVQKTTETTDKHRSSGRSRHSRRAAVAERPHNIRAATILALSYGNDNQRLIPGARGEDNQMAHRSAYRGSHRAGSVHHTDETPAQQRSSRVGRHHADPSDDLSNRW